MQTARLLHLLDSALPTGAFAYSYGLESCLALGLISSEADLRQHLYATLQQAASLELPFASACFAVTDDAALHPLVEEYDALLLIPALHRASAAQGRSWLKLLTTFYPAAGLDELRAWFVANDLPPHFTLVCALSLRRAGFALADVRLLLLHTVLRDQVSAAIRLGFLGPLAGHRLQHAFYAVFDHLLATTADRSYTQATRAGFLLEVAQVLHDDLYSRLFQT